MNWFLLLARCLSIEAPAPEDKLATLSDIAQEYGVEWDAHTAAKDMLPSGPPPPPNPSGAWGAGAGGGPPPGGFPSQGPSGGAPNRFPGVLRPCMRRLPSANSSVKTQLCPHTFIKNMVFRRWLASYFQLKIFL